MVWRLNDFDEYTSHFLVWQLRRPLSGRDRAFFVRRPFPKSPAMVWAAVPHRCAGGRHCQVAWSERGEAVSRSEREPCGAASSSTHASAAE